MIMDKSTTIRGAIIDSWVEPAGVAVREVSVPGDVAANPYGNGGGEDDEEVKHKRLTTSKFEEIPVRVELMVRFEIRSAAAKGRPADK